MALTPVDLMHMDFKKSVRGYSCAQVDSVLDSVRQTLEEMLRERSELQKKLDAATQEIERVRKIESTMTEALTLAQKTADETKANAHRKAEMIVSEAEQERVRMTIEAQQEKEKHRAEIKLLEDAKARFELELRSLIKNHLDYLDRTAAASEGNGEVA